MAWAQSPCVCSSRSKPAILSWHVGKGVTGSSGPSPQPRPGEGVGEGWYRQVGTCSTLWGFQGREELCNKGEGSDGKGGSGGRGALHMTLQLVSSSATWYGLVRGGGEGTGSCTVATA